MRVRKQKYGEMKLSREGEKGVALVVAKMVVAILAVIGMTALAFSSTETRIAGSELERMQSNYAAQSGLEKMTNDFSDLFRTKMRPTAADFTTIINSPPSGLTSEFNFVQTLNEDSDLLNQLRTIQGISAPNYPSVAVPDGPYAGLTATLIPYKISSTATRKTGTNSQVQLERNFNNYLIPLFQFGLFSNDDIQFHPGPLMTFNGRIHSNQNIYALTNVIFQDRVTVAGEFVRDVWKSGMVNANTNVRFRINGTDVYSSIGMGSVKAGSGYPGGPNLVGATAGTRGYYPGSPNGIINAAFDSTSVSPVIAGTPDRFGGNLLTGSTGAKPLKLPLQLDGSNPAELIKRALPGDSTLLAQSRYHNKAAIRVLIDDDSAGNGAANVAGIPAGKGLLLQDFVPTALNGNNVLRKIDNNGNVTGIIVMQKNRDGSTSQANTVRAIKNANNLGTDNASIPPGSGITGKIYIEVVKPDGTTIDVTQTILSMGITEGEPNGIFYLQRPLWAAFVQGSRDRSGNSFDLVTLTESQTIADGEIPTPAIANFNSTRGYLALAAASVNDDAAGTVVRQASPPASMIAGVTPSMNQIVPIDIYNVREGWYQSSMDRDRVWYERGVTSVVEINMKSLAKWVDGVYDANLLSGTNAVSANIRDDGGYVVYVSDRRGDRVKTEYIGGSTPYQSTNGIVDNEDIYGPNGILDTGEDVIDFGWTAPGVTKKGTLQNDTAELPTTGFFDAGTSTDSITIRVNRSAVALSRSPAYFRRSVRTFNADVLTTTAGAGKLSNTKGLAISTENMLYTWGNFNSTGVSSVPANGSTLNDGVGYTGPQIPASFASDAYFPVSKTWFDASGTAFPGNNGNRPADEGVTVSSNVTQSTSVRAALIAGATTGEMNGSPGRNPNNERGNGGIHNFPRFLESWGDDVPFNYTGSIAPIYHSTQAIAQWECDWNCGIIYTPPRRNWSFDTTFLNPFRLPPGTPLFQYTSATAFRQKLY